MTTGCVWVACSLTSHLQPTIPSVSLGVLKSIGLVAQDMDMEGVVLSGRSACGKSTLSTSPALITPTACTHHESLLISAYAAYVNCHAFPVDGSPTESSRFSQQLRKLTKWRCCTTWSHRRLRHCLHFF